MANFKNHKTMKFNLRSYLLIILLFFAGLTIYSCSEDPVDIIIPGQTTPDENTDDEEESSSEGLSYSPSTPNADKELTITFTAESTSALYDYSGDVYAHIGVVDAGTWLYVAAEWSENTDKCKMKSLGDNSWSLTLSPSVRDWFSSGETSISSIGIVIRNSDGTLKGIDSDSFIPVADTTYLSFAPAAVITKSLPANVEHGINIIDSSTITFVLHDSDTDGKSHDFAHIVGDFNDWTLSNTTSSQMNFDSSEKCWWITVSNLVNTKEYAFQYYLGYTDGETIRIGDPYSRKILDPDNDQYIASSTYPAEDMVYPDGGRGIVSVTTTATDSYTWKNSGFAIEDKNDLIIYELLLRDFTATSDIDGAIEKLDYLASLGVNAIELMPTQEFDGNDSWGYNPAYFFAMDKAYGTDDDYKRFVDECHSRGMAVILDVVYNHTTGNHPMAKLYWNDDDSKTSDNNPYYNVDAPHPYSVFHDLNHENEVVRNYVKRNLEFLLTEYRFDGFRFDLTKGLTQKSSTESTASQYDATRIAILKDYYTTVIATNPDAIMICEHFCDTAEERELANEGMKLWRNANNAYCQSAMGWSSDSDFEYIYSSTSMPFGSCVGYMESHDEERMAYKALTYGDSEVKSSITARMGNLKANAALSLLVPGPKMIWQFGEMGYDISIDEGDRTSKKPLHWEYLDDASRAELHETYSNLLAIRAFAPTLFDDDVVVTMRMSANDWDNGKYLLLEANDEKKLLIGSNFTEKELSLSETIPNGWGHYYEYMSSEDKPYIGGSEITIAPHSFVLYTNFDTTNGNF